MTNFYKLCQMHLTILYFQTLGTTETWMLIDQFVPFKEIHIHLKDFMTAQWRTAYLGQTVIIVIVIVTALTASNLDLGLLC
jgi:hypothetical protein